MIATDTQPDVWGGAARSRVVQIPPMTADEWVRSGEAVLFDVRGADTRASGTIPGARLMPLERLSCAGVHEACAGRRPVFICADGARSIEAAEQYAQSGCSDGERAYSVGGGVRAWRVAGMALTAPEVEPARCQERRSVRWGTVGAGVLVVLGALLGSFASAWWLVLSGAVGCGLVVAGVARRGRGLPNG
ncbi:MAG: rhodanese-like domain-containing protein [Phycisphaerales bacterium JB040]